MDTYPPIFIVEIDGKELPEDISQHVESFSYEDNDEKMDELKLRITDLALSFVDHPQLQEGKEVRVRWGYIGNLSEARTCTIKEIDYSFSQDGTLRINLDALDKGHKLTGRSSRECWNDKKIKNIVEDIAKKHNLKPIVDIPGDIKHEFISEGGKNDMVFLKELAVDTGCLTWVENDELHFVPNKVTEPVMKFRYREDRDGYMQSFSIKSKAEKGKGESCGTEAAGMEPLTKQEIKETTTAKDTGLLLNLENGQTENETPLQQKSDETGRVIPTPSPTKAQAKQEGIGKVTETAMQTIEASMETIGLPTLKAKDSITVENIGEKFSGNWRVKKVTHRLSKSGYTCDLKLVKSDLEGKSATKNGTSSAPKTNNTGSSTSAGESKNAVPPPVEVNLS